MAHKLDENSSFLLEDDEDFSESCNTDEEEETPQDKSELKADLAVLQTTPSNQEELTYFYEILMRSIFHKTTKALKSRIKALETALPSASAAVQASPAVEAPPAALEIPVESIEMAELPAQEPSSCTATPADLQDEDDGFQSVVSRRKRRETSDPETVPRKTPTIAPPDQAPAATTSTSRAGFRNTPPEPKNTKPQDQDPSDRHKGEDKIRGSRRRREVKKNHHRLQSYPGLSGILKSAVPLLLPARGEKAIHGSPRFFEHWSADSILEDLRKLGFHPHSAARYFNRNRQPTPLVLVQLPREEKSIFSLTELRGVEIRGEAQRNKSRRIQCHRCQLHGHAQARCTAAHKCVKCGQLHATAECTKPRDQPATCANCGGPHTANYLGCPRNPKQILKAKTTRRDRPFTLGTQDNSRLVAPPTPPQQAAAAVPPPLGTEPNAMLQAFFVSMQQQFQMLLQSIHSVGA
ncbi:uncharacterized protein LOC126745948 [Anthonomus grandis grandis]|uniref:uncharacterized protein LOC126745948 n=1 Tax=Anthonomus grandis grandis TaxID=2921223 RepID=UPI002165B450|nr:uncharacterized protein LOC126745948 [Anthonomus grandis grandis]